MKPIAGFGQYPFNIGGISVNAAKIADTTYVKQLYIVQQRSYDYFDLISDTGEVFSFIKLVYRDENGNILKYGTPDADIASTLMNGTFCIKAEDAFNKKYGFAVQYQLNKIKLHNGEVIFRNQEPQPTPVVLTDVVISPDTFSVIVGDTQDFAAQYTPSTWPTQTGKWTYDTSLFDLVSQSGSKLSLIAKAIGTSTTITYEPDSDFSLTTYSTGTVHDNPSQIIHLSLTPNPIDVEITETFIVDVVYDPLDYEFKAGKWTVADESIVQFVSGDGDSATFRALDIGSTSITYALDHDPLQVASTLVEIDYAPLQKVTVDPTNVTDVVGKTGTVVVTYEPDNAQKGGKWLISNPRSLQIVGAKSADYNYELLAVGTAVATFVPSATYALPSPTVNFTVEYDELENVELTPTSVSGIVPGDTGKIDIRYTPPTAQTGGTWTFNPPGVVEQDMSLSTDTEMYYTAKAPGSTTATFHTHAYLGRSPKTVAFEVDEPSVTKITLNPTSEVVNVGDDFYVDITYEPATAIHGGTWNVADFSDYITLESDSTPERAHFKAIAKVDVVDLIYSKGTVSATNKCTVKAVALASITLSPTSESVKLGADFYIDITYNPDTAEHVGTWNTSDFEQYVTLESDSTPDKAHFKAISAVDTVNLIYSSGSVSSEPNVCTVLYPDLVSVKITPEESDITHLTVGDEIHFDISYTPNDAEHKGNWIYDNQYFTLESDSTPDKAHFTAIKITPTPVTLTYESGKESDSSHAEIIHDGLISVTLSPKEQYCSENEIFEVNIKYDPDTAEHVGTWDYDHDHFEYQDSFSNGDKAVFEVIKKDDKPYTLTYTSNGKSDTTICHPDYIPTTGVRLSPTEEVAKKGTTFSIDIFYEPDGAELIGEWDYDKTYLEYDETKSTNQVAYFKVLERTDTPLTLTYTSNGQSATNTCHAQYDQLMEMKLDPLTEDVNEGQDFYITVTYIPDTAEHYGRWTYDEQYLEIQSDSTPDKAHFVLNKKSPTPLELKYDMDGITVVNTCNGNYDALTTLALTPTTVEVLNGDQFHIDITYIPITANHTGLWSITDSVTGEDASDYVSLDHTSTPDKAIFNALKLTYNAINLTYTSADKTATAVCNVSFDKLTGITVSPTSESVKVNDTFDLAVVYTPDTAEEGGDWEFDAEYIESVTPTKNGVYSFKLLKYSDDPLTLTFKPTANPALSASSVCTSEALDLTGITLNPTSETVNAGDEFYIDVTYEPHGAVHSGTWNETDFSEFIKYEAAKSNPDRHYFTALKENDTPISLVYSSGSISATNTCTVDYSPLVSINMKPSTNDYSKGELVPVEITFVPDTARHVMGEFSGDALQYMELQQGSTTDSATFLMTGFDKKTVDGSTPKTYTLTYTVPGVDPSSVQIAPLRPYVTSFTMTNPSPITCKVNDQTQLTCTVEPDDSVPSVSSVNSFAVSNTLVESNEAINISATLYITKPTEPDGLSVDLYFTGRSKPLNIKSTNSLVFHATSSPIESYTFLTTREKKSEATLGVYKTIWLSLTNTPTDAVYEGTMDYDSEFLELRKYVGSYSCKALKYSSEPQVITYTDTASGVSNSITINITDSESPDDSDDENYIP